MGCDMVGLIRFIPILMLAVFLLLFLALGTSNWSHWTQKLTIVVDTPSGSVSTSGYLRVSYTAF